MIRKHDSVIVRMVSRILIPFIQLFGLYVLFHGHYSPGGGFQAGVLFGGGIILSILVDSRKEMPKLAVNKELMTACAGLVLYTLIGGISLLYGSNLFNFGAISFFPGGAAMQRYWSILIAEIGVTVVVAMTLVLIFHVLALATHKTGEEA